MGEGPLQHLFGQGWFRNRAAPLLWHVCLLAPLGILLPVGMQIQFSVEQDRSISIGVGQKDPDLTIGNLAYRPAILGSHTHRLGAFFDKTRLIDHSTASGSARCVRMYS